MNKLNVKCPKCNWKPTISDLWKCKCNHLWNTFDTAGQCPKCKKIWQDTCCGNCDKWSKHYKWYPQLDDLLKDELSNLISNRKQ